MWVADSCHRTREEQEGRREAEGGQEEAEGCRDVQRGEGGGGEGGGGGRGGGGEEEGGGEGADGAPSTLRSHASHPLLLGALAAVIYTDTLQAVIMLLGSFILTGFGKWGRGRLRRWGGRLEATGLGSELRTLPSLGQWTGLDWPSPWVCGGHLPQPWRSQVGSGPGNIWIPLLPSTQSGLGPQGGPLIWSSLHRKTGPKKKKR